MLPSSTLSTARGESAHPPPGRPALPDAGAPPGGQGCLQQDWGLHAALSAWILPCSAGLLPPLPCVCLGNGVLVSPTQHLLSFHPLLGVAAPTSGFLRSGFSQTAAGGAVWRWGLRVTTGSWGGPVSSVSKACSLCITELPVLWNPWLPRGEMGSPVVYA